ncbi:MAG: hypothetical protein LBR28_06580, partial [Bacteroidales bacterium]|nr:hypothetical protein [Bacteroidales bacterium]
MYSFLFFIKNIQNKDTIKIIFIGILDKSDAKTAYKSLINITLQVKNEMSKKFAFIAAAKSR